MAAFYSMCELLQDVREWAALEGPAPVTRYFHDASPGSGLIMRTWATKDGRTTWSIRYDKQMTGECEALVPAMRAMRAGAKAGLGKFAVTETAFAILDDMVEAVSMGGVIRLPEGICPPCVAATIMLS